MSARVKVEPGSSSGGHHLGEQHMSTSTQRICYVCGGGGALYPLNSRPRERVSYFPFLEQYEIPHGACRPDADGVVVACTLCYSFLTQQWESFERSRTPHSKRLYWLKRTDNGHYIGAEMRLQGEYASQVIGMSPEPGSRGGGPGGQHGHCFPMVNSPVLTASSRHSTPVNRAPLTQPGYSNVQSAPTTSNNNSNKEFYRENRPNSGTTLNQSASSHNNEDLYVDSSSLLLDLRSGSNVGAAKEFNNLLKSREGRHQGEQTQQLFKTETNSKQGETHVANGALDLSMPDKNASTEVCYLCGEDVLRGTLVSIYAKPITNCPFFPSLLLHPRPSRSHPMDHSGCVQACGPCHQYLLQQWDALQRQNVPHSERHYRLRKHSNAHYSPRMRPVTLSPHTPSPMQPAIPTHTSSAFICFLCGQEFAWNQRRVLYSGPNAEGEPPLHFLERVKPSRGALPLSTTGEALTCSSCYKAAHKQRHAYVDSLRNSAASDEQQQQHHSRSQHHQHHSHQQHQQHNYNQRNQEADKYNKHNRDESNHKVVCQMCRQSVSKRYVKYLRNPPESGKPTCPSLVQGEDEGFPVCPTCHTSLLNRWEAVEDGRPVAKHYAPANQNEVNNRKMTPTSNSADIHRNGGGGHVNLDMALRIKVPTPDNDLIRLHQSQHTHGSGVTLLTTISNRSGSPVNLTYNQFPPDDAKSSSATATPTTSTLLSNALDLSGASRSATVPLESSSSSKKSRRDSLLHDNSFVCYVCGFHIKSGRSYTIHSYPLKSKDGLDTPPTPFFPFLTMHLAPPDADPVADDGTVATCTFCYHSLMEQWVAYETTVARHPQDRNPWSRQFNCRDYVCYVCGVSTYRKRVESIRVADFTFLVEHSRPLGSLVLDGGESVVVCLMCYDTLSVQWHDFERMKVPIELRKYNWITSPPPPEDENMASRHRKVNGENVPESRHGVKSEDELDTRLRDGSVRQHHTGLGHSSKASVQVQPTSGGKSSGNMIAVPPPPPPHHAQISPSGSGGIQTHNNNARTSSFAAALRKLAEQATDPVTDKELSPVSPANSPTPTSTPKRGTPSLVLISDSHSSSHSSTTASHIPSVNFTSSPTVTMAPTQSYIDGRKNSERPVIVHSRTSAKSLFDDSKKTGYSSHRSHGEAGQEDGNRSGSTAMTRGCPPPLYGDRVDVSSSPAKSMSTSYLSSHQPGEAKSSGGYYSDRVREESSYLTSRPPPTQPLRLLSPSWSHHTPTSTSSRLDDHIQVNSSFQPYRPSPEDLRHGISPHIASTYESTSPYGYHPAAFLPPQLQHPSFRFDDPLYMERCSLFRPPLFSLPHPGVLPPHHALSFFPGSRYTPELMPHPLSLVSPTGSQLLAQERLKLEEQRRERTFEIFDQERSRGRERDQEREADYLNDAVNGKEQEKRQRNSWSIGPTIESPGGTGSVGSITQGIPRADLVSRASPVRPMMPSPSPSRLTSAGSSVELPSSHVSRHSKSPTELADRGEGRSSYSNNYHAKTYISSSYNRERSPTIDRDHFNVSRVSNYETGHYESSDGNNTIRKTSRSSGTRSKDHAAYNSVSRHLNVSDNSYSNVNHLVPEVVQSNCGSDASRQNVSTVEQSNDDDGRGKKLSTIAFHSLFARDSEGISGKFVEPEARAAANTNHNVEELNIVPSWDHYLQLSPTPSRQQLKLDKCDQIVPIAKNYQEPVVLCDKMKSKLDLAAERARLKRFNNQDESSDVDEEDGIDFSNRYQNLIIYSGPPLPLDASREKLHFMSQIGLVTQKRKRELELDQYLKQPHVLNNTYNTKLEKCVVEEKPHVPWFLNAACISMKYSADDLRREPELSQKVQFFLNLNLNLVPLGKRDDNEKILQAVIDEKIRRNGFARPCHSKLIPSTVNLLTASDENSPPGPSRETTSARSSKRKIEMVDSPENDQPMSKYILNSKGRPSTVSDNQKTASTTEGQAQKSRSQENRSVLFSSAAENVSEQYKKYGRDFAQEFHESVWLQTKAVTKKSNVEVETTSGGRNCISDGISPSPSLNACLSESGIESQSSWPGIEMLMAAYQKHQQEQRLERDVLSEQCSRLLTQNRELNNTAEKLSQKMADYLNLKTNMNAERQCLHQAIDNLKCFLKDLR